MTEGRSGLCNELHNSYSSTNTSRAIMSKRIIWPKHAARNAGTLNSYDSFPQKDMNEDRAQTTLDADES